MTDAPDVAALIAEARLYAKGLMPAAFCFPRHLTARLAYALEAAQRDTARLDWLERMVPSGELRRRAFTLPAIWGGSIREFIDAAIAQGGRGEGHA